MFEDLAAIAHVGESGRGNGDVRQLEVDVAGAHGDDAVRIGDSGRMQQELVDQAENGRVCADAEGEGRDYDSGKSRAAAHAAQGVTEVGREAVEGGPAPHGAAVFEMEGAIAELAQGLDAGLGFGESRVYEVGDFFVKMSLEFVVEIGVVHDAVSL